MSEIEPQYLHLAYPADRGSVDRFDIKHRETAELVDHAAVFTVIGSSHCIAVPKLAYCELVSCEPIEAEPTEKLRLTEGMARTVRYESGPLTAHTAAEVRPLAAFPDPTTFDISHRFGPRAYTTIDRPESDTYETYHTYPERDIALYTRTELALSDSCTETHQATGQMQRSDLLTSE